MKLESTQQPPSKTYSEGAKGIDLKEQKLDPTAIFTQSFMTSFSCSSAFPISLMDYLRNKLRGGIDFFRNLLHCLGKFFSKPVLSKEEREHRLSKTDAEIQKSLIIQEELAAKQMKSESPMSFKYLDAPEKWEEAQAHQETVGKYQIGICHAQGRRKTMEDEHLALSFKIKIGDINYPVDIFSTLDGHGGSQAACFIRDRLQEKLQIALVEFNSQGLTDAGIWRALKITCVRLNDDLKNERPDLKREGTAAVIVMFLDGTIWTANVGDSRAALDNQGIPIRLTYDAKPDDPIYRPGIEHRGGKVIEKSGVARIDGVIAMARAFGDHELKGSVSARPKIRKKHFSEVHEESQIVICCDGIYEVARTIDVIAAAYTHRHLSPEKLARNLVYSAYESGSGDNLSVMVIRL